MDLAQIDTEKAAFLDALRTSLEAGTFLKLTLGKHRGPKHAVGPELRCQVSRVLLKDKAHLRFVTRRGTQDHTENLNLDAAIARLEREIGGAYLSATLFSTEQNVALVYNKKRVGRLTRSRPTETELASTEHNRTKSYLVDPAAPYLRHLGITQVGLKGERDAQVKPSMYAKYRQICRFVEILDQLLTASELKDTPAPRIFDIGSGKGYLTFALHDHLTRRLGKEPTTTGIEANAGLVSQCNTVVAQCGMPGLSFVASTADSQSIGALDVLIALHACDTATDDAIHFGIAGGAALIVCAPCCQHEIAPQLEAAGSPMEGLLKFGLLRQRQADLVTDAARALLLEAHGYEVRIIEFVSTEHTAKNLLLAAVRSNKVDRQAATDQYRRLAALMGFSEHRLNSRLISRED